MNFFDPIFFDDWDNFRRRWISDCPPYSPTLPSPDAPTHVQVALRGWASMPSSECWLAVCSASFRGLQVHFRRPQVSLRYLHVPLRKVSVTLRILDLAREFLFHHNRAHHG